MSDVVAHAGGLGWDELLVFALPVVILVVLQVLGRRKAREAAANEQDVDVSGGDDEGAGTG